MKAPALPWPPFRGITAAVATAVTVVVAGGWPTTALAQGGMPAIPGASGYTGSVGAPPGSDGAPPPGYGAANQEDGSSFSIPLPGGGQIQVNGPASEPLNFPPPTETWSTLQNTPFSPGGVPLGPVPLGPAPVR